MDDLQFAQRYGQLVEPTDGECAVFDFHNELGTVRSVFLKREIPVAIDGQAYFEAVTPFTYGGPVILACRDGRRWELVAAFERAFRLYCLEHNIVSESVRFHPVFGNASDFAGCYDMEFIRATAAIDLRVKNPVCDEFTPRCKNMLFKALENGVDYRVTADPVDAASFAALYVSIAAQQHSKDGALDARLLAKSIDKMGPDLVVTEAVYREQTIALSFSRFSNGVLQPELTAALPGFTHLSPLHVMNYGLTCWGKQHGASFIHFGGGEGAAFNEQFSRNTRFESWRGRKIWNRTAYAKLFAGVENVYALNDLAKLEGLAWQ